MVLPAGGPEVLQDVAGEGHDRQAVGPYRLGQVGQRPGLVERLAAQEGQALDVVDGGGFPHRRREVGPADGVAGTAEPSCGG